MAKLENMSLTDKIILSLTIVSALILLVHRLFPAEQAYLDITYIALVIFTVFTSVYIGIHATNFLAKILSGLFESRMFKMTVFFILTAIILHFILIGLKEIPFLKLGSIIALKKLGLF